MIQEAHFVLKLKVDYLSGYRIVPAESLEKSDPKNRGRLFLVFVTVFRQKRNHGFRKSREHFHSGTDGKYAL